MKKITKIDTVAQVKPAKLKVAAYARVSTSSEEQLLSLENQKLHYEQRILANSNWEFVEMYFDEGISGTKIDKRNGLKRLLQDCETGKVDFILTKSISRFSRNALDCLEIVRRLIDLNIFIEFEKENIRKIYYSKPSQNSSLFLLPLLIRIHEFWENIFNFL